MDNFDKSIHIISRALIVNKGHILLTYHPPTEHIYTNLPGGHVEWSESAEHALKRELLEETGLVFETAVYKGVLEYFFERKGVGLQHEYTFVFLATSSHLQYPHVPISPEENCAFKWIPLKNLATSKILPEPLIDLIPRWLDERFSSALHSSLKKQE